MNKPIAWKSTLQSKWFIPNEDMETGKYDKQFWIPLYTYPVKELTNDEMRKVINEIVDGVTVSEMVTFLAISKAILRKAQSK